MLHPVSDYQPPKLPTMQEMQENPAPLKQMPNRWRKKAGALMCASFIGAAAMLSSCAELEEMYPQWRSYLEARNNAELEIEAEYNRFVLPPDRFHHGGSPSAPFYVAHLTETEVLDIIQTRLEAAGLNFSAIPQGHVLEQFESSLFDEENNIGIVNLGSDAFSAEFVLSDLSEETEGTVFGVFYSQPKTVIDGPPPPPNPGMVARPGPREEARLTLVERLNNQIEDFIELLREKGIL